MLRIYRICWEYTGYVPRKCLQVGRERPHEDTLTKQCRHWRDSWPLPSWLPYSTDISFHRFVFALVSFQSYPQTIFVIEKACKAQRPKDWGWITLQEGNAALQGTVLLLASAHIVLHLQIKSSMSCVCQMFPLQFKSATVGWSAVAGWASPLGVHLEGVHPACGLEEFKRRREA